VFIGKSRIKDAEEGLFSRRIIDENAVITHYGGIEREFNGVTTEELRDNEGLFLDPIRNVLIFGSKEYFGYYANDILNDDKCNAEIRYHSASNKYVCLGGIAPDTEK
jgi:hypothetical protein